jgi:hypothetical protein
MWSASRRPGSGALSTVTATCPIVGRWPSPASQEPQLATQAADSSGSQSQVVVAAQRSVAV